MIKLRFTLTFDYMTAPYGIDDPKKIARREMDLVSNDLDEILVLMQGNETVQYRIEPVEEGT